VVDRILLFSSFSSLGLCSLLLLAVPIFDVVLPVVNVPVEGIPGRLAASSFSGSQKHWVDLNFQAPPLCSVSFLMAIAKPGILTTAINFSFRRVSPSDPSWRAKTSTEISPPR